MITVVAASAVPPYEQIRSQLAAQIQSGDLAAGARLPPVRTLAADLDLAPNTVARAYRELEKAGLVHARRRTGTVVADRVQRRQDALDAAAHAYAAAAREHGATPSDALSAIHRALQIKTSPV